MENLRKYRIAEISRYTLAHANDALTWAQDKLEDLYKVEYEGNTPKELFLEIHLTFDDIYLITRKLNQLLDAQLDEYHAAGSVQRPLWDKKEACKKLLEATKNDPSEKPVRRLTDMLYSSLSSIPHTNRADILVNLATMLEEGGFICSQHYTEFLREFPRCP